MTRLPYETQGGAFSEGATFTQLIEYLRLAQEAAAIIGHNSKEKGDINRGQGFLAASEMLGRTCELVTQLAMKGEMQ